LPSTAQALGIDDELSKMWCPPVHTASILRLILWFALTAASVTMLLALDLLEVTERARELSCLFEAGCSSVVLGKKNIVNGL
jgi:hypothetical protein